MRNTQRQKRLPGCTVREDLFKVCDNVHIPVNYIKTGRNDKDILKSANVSNQA